MLISFIRWINWEHVVIALGFMLLGYVVGIIGFGAEFKLSDWVTSFSSVVVAIVAVQGLSAYKKQYHYSSSKSAAEEMLKIDYAKVVFEMNARFEHLWWQLMQVDHIYRSDTEDKALLKPLYISIKQHIEFFSIQREKVVISEYNYLKLRKDHREVFNNIASFKVRLGKDINKINSIFSAIGLMRDDLDLDGYIRLARLLFHKVGDISEDIYGENFAARHLINSIYQPFGDPQIVQDDIHNKLIRILAQN